MILEVNTFMDANTTANHCSRVLDDGRVPIASRLGSAELYLLPLGHLAGIAAARARLVSSVSAQSRVGRRQFVLLIVDYGFECGARVVEGEGGEGREICHGIVIALLELLPYGI